MRTNNQSQNQVQRTAHAVRLHARVRFSPYEGWVPANCLKINDKWYFNIKYHDISGGWEGKAMCGTVIRYAYNGEIIIINTKNNKQLSLEI